ncbi:MAG TPA: CRISPR-associated protein, partial [Cyanobacteria bacterium UBA11166]|nr:CRISPR-associated protein [Cyanobacteria bacterium UBA11166]
MSAKCYTVITFAPVQGFIEKSRKLRDLYGSSYILSLLSWVICQAALKLNCVVVSPALPNVTQGMPNQIIVEGEIDRENIEKIKGFFNQAWSLLADTCQSWIEKNIQTIQDEEEKEQQWYYESWHRDWKMWKKYSWEFFYAIGEPGESITEVRQRLNQVKNSRDWTGINWQGESSTLSGADGIAYPYLGPKLDLNDPHYRQKITALCQVDPRNYNYQAEKTTVRRFYRELSYKLGESFIEFNGLKIKDEEKIEQIREYGSSFIDIREELSIPELIKRLITHQAIVENLTICLRDELKLEVRDDEDQQKIPEWKLNQVAEEIKPRSFGSLSRLKDKPEDKKYWTAWFLGDGDGAGKYFQSLKPEEEAQKLKEFSKEMRNWGKTLRKQQDRYLKGKGRMIYAGGDDFLGVLYKANQQIPALECLELFYTFKSGIWQKPERKKISASVGFVWAAPGVPQRDVLQHCHAAEGAAKSTGRDRISFRILFNSGNYLEWVCPWWLLDKVDLLNFFPSFPDKTQNLIESYQDRDNGDNWTHFYRDVATLESRHAFSDKSIDIALGLMEIYFASTWRDIIGNTDNWWNHYNEHEIQEFTGILGDPKRFNPEYQETPELRNELNNSPKVKEAFNNWVINLAKVGFHLTDNHG